MGGNAPSGGNRKPNVLDHLREALRSRYYGRQREAAQFNEVLSVIATPARDKILLVGGCSLAPTSVPVQPNVRIGHVSRETTEWLSSFG